MRRICVFTYGLVLLLCVSVPLAGAKYASYSLVDSYLSWGSAQALYSALDSTTVTQASPHGGYTKSTFKCVVCHSTHRAYSARSDLGAGSDYSLLEGTSSCANCHAAWGSNITSKLVEIGITTGGPHMGPGGSGCETSACHGSVHGTGTPSKYAIVRRFNLTNAPLGTYNIDNQLDDAIAAGNYVKQDATQNPVQTSNTSSGIPGNLIGTESLDQAMKAYATGYVCYPCHGNASRSVASADYATAIGASGRTGHLSTGSSSATWIPTCEGCHDVVGVATKTTAFPHANRGIEVYVGRFNHITQLPEVSTSISAGDTDSERYGLWMTAGDFGQNTLAQPLVGPIANSNADFVSLDGLAPSIASQNTDAMLVDGVCTKCHLSTGLR